MRPRKRRFFFARPLARWLVVCCVVALMLGVKVGMRQPVPRSEGSALERSLLDAAKAPARRHHQALRHHQADAAAEQDDVFLGDTKKKPAAALTTVDQPPPSEGPLRRRRRRRDVQEGDVTGRREVPRAPDDAADEPTTKELDGTTVLVVVCFERFELLRRSLESVTRVAPCGLRMLASRDGGSTRFQKEVKREVDAAFEEMRRRCGSGGDRRFVVHSAQTPEGSGYHKLARHFAFALRTAFSSSDQTVERVIILEEDLVVAPDFFRYFGFVAPILDADDTLMAASAWNDNGQRGKVRDSGRVLRSDFFPGLGWMVTRRVWENQLEATWPAAYWDDWLREPEQRKSRHFLRPEICRTFHLSSNSGTSRGQYGDFLSKIQLHDGIAEDDFGDPQDLHLAKYDARLRDDLRAAVKVRTPADVDALPEDVTTVYVEYLGIDEHRRDAFPARARALGIMDNVKAGVPRTAYRGVVSFWRGNRYIYLAPPLADVEMNLFHISDEGT